ncbi:MAG TPA: hypothetical protein DDX75_02045 [Phycisphaerales bacterium]|nr:hypothetical protein [Phycisphaerales bacterium]
MDFKFNRAVSTLKIVCIFIFIFFTSTIITATGESDANQILLEQEVEKLLKQGDNVSIRHEIEKIYQLAEIYEKQGLDKQAIALFNNALEVNAGNIPCQMHLAKLLKKNGNNEEAVSKASIVFELAEDDKLIREAEKFLTENNIQIPEGKTVAVDANVEIVLVPMGDINYRIMRSLRDSLKEKLGINFSISPKIKRIGLVDRTFTFVYINDHFDWLKGMFDPNKFPEVVKELGYTEKQLEDPNAKNDFIRSIYISLEENGRSGLKEYNEGLVQAQKNVQYDSSRLIDEMAKEFRIDSNSCVKGYLAVTDKDIFANDSRFLFGNAAKGYGVMSYHRYTWEFNGEEQNRPRLIKRAVKQGMSSCSFVLGIPRCTNPNCARAYPHSLQEHDQKPDTLCTLCKNRLDDYLKSAAKD